MVSSPNTASTEGLLAAILPEEAWRALHHAMHTGKLRLGNGEERELQTNELSRIFQFVASREAKRGAVDVPLPDGFKPQRTGE